jgi:hypothetical protein
VLVWRFVYTGALNQLLDKFKAAEMEYDMECYYVYGDYNEIDYEYYDNMYESL